MSGVTEHGPIEVKPLVTVRAADILELAGTATADPIVTALLTGCRAGRPDRMVTVQADDLFHLLDAAEGGGRKGKKGGDS